MNQPMSPVKPLRMPAEWEPQSTIWLTWPDNVETWPHNRVEAQIEFTALVKTLAQMIPVQVLVNQDSLAIAQRNLIQPDTVNIRLVDIRTNDAWARDYAPTFVVDANHQLVAIDWDYNAWGGKYPPFGDDQRVAEMIATGMNVPRIQPGLCFEGGAIEVNGQGLALSTISCAADPNRNRDVRPAERLTQFEQAFARYLGAERTIWLPGDSIAGDDTDGHIDQLARFTDANSIVYAWCEDESDPQFAGLAANLDSLREGLERLSDGTDYELIPLPLPEPMERHGRRVPASYCNFLITNDLVVVPQFSVAQDSIALHRLRQLFADRHVIGLPSCNLSVGLGSFHCLSQQVPRATACDGGQSPDN